MPAYKQKITRQMEYEEFEQGIQDLPEQRKAFLAILFFAGCRVSEALALTRDNISCTADTIYIEFKRLKGSKPTDPIPIPRTEITKYLCEQYGKLFDFSRVTAWRQVKRVFPRLYPHYFRMNRIVKISDKFGDASVYSFTGICAQSIDHYRGKVDISKIGKALKEEIG